MSAILDGAGAQMFKPGELVEYHSASKGSWIRARVLNAKPNGTYDLDCKPDVPADKIRPLPLAPACHEGEQLYAVGEVVEYFSASKQDWVRAKVTRYNRTSGTFDLDCKPDVPPDRIRKRAAASNGHAPPPPPAYGAASSVVSSTSGVMAFPTADCIGRSAAGGSSGSTARPTPQSAGQAKPLGSAPGLFGSSSLPAPVQLLSVQRKGDAWWYEVCPNGVGFLEAQGNRRIAVASICGLYRTGKSYLLNLLLERVQRCLPLFQVGSATQSSTEGLWLWGALDGDDPHSPLLAFVDCEGFGSAGRDKTRDAQLMTFCALLSSVLLLNTKGPLNENLFNAMALTCRFAEHVEERGNEASRPVLMWVLRDFSLHLVDQAGNHISPDEYLEQALRAAPTVTEPDDDDEDGEGAREARQSLLRFFDRRSCTTLVQPIMEESQLQQLGEPPYEALHSEFRAGVEALRAQVLSECRANPKTVGGQPLTCVAFTSLVRQLVSALNSHKVISLKGAWETVQHTTCGSLADRLRQQSCEVLRALAEGHPHSDGTQLPLADSALQAFFDGQRAQLLAQWKEQAVGDEAVRQEYWEELQKSLEHEEAAVRVQNSRLGDEKLAAAMQAWESWLDDDGESQDPSLQLTHLVAEMPAAAVVRMTKVLVESTGRRVNILRGDLRSVKQRSSTVQKKSAAGEAQLESLREQLEQATASERAAHNRLQELVAAIEASSVREEEMKAEQRDLAERESALSTELEKMKAVAARAEEEDRRRQQDAYAARSDFQSAAQEKMRLEEDIERARSAAAQLQAECERLKSSHAAELEAKGEELQKTREQLQVTVESAEAARAWEHEAKAKIRELSNEVGSLRSELESARGAAAKSDAERLACERATRQARWTADGVETEKQTLEADLGAAQEQLAKKAQLEEELKTMCSQQEGMKRELEAVRQQLEQERHEHAAMLEQAARDHALEMENITEKSQVQKQGSLMRRENTMRLEFERATNAKLQAMQEERKADLQQMQEAMEAAEADLRAKDAELQEVQAEVRKVIQEREAIQAQSQQLTVRRRSTLDQRESAMRATLEELKATAATAESERVAAQRREQKARWEADTANADRQRIEAELERLRTQVASCESERDMLRGESQRIRAEHKRMVEEVQQRVEDARKAQVSALDDARNQLKDTQQSAAEMEGNLIQKAEGFQRKVHELEAQVQEKENEKLTVLQEKEDVEQQLEDAKSKMAKAAKVVNGDRYTQLDGGAVARTRPAAVKTDTKSANPPQCCSLQ